MGLGKVSLKVEEENGSGAVVEVGGCCCQAGAALCPCLAGGLWLFSSAYTLTR